MISFALFEKEIIEAIIRAHPAYETKLLKQYAHSNVIKREFGHQGFFTQFQIADNQASLGENICLMLEDIYAYINDMKNSTGYILWINNGLISVLEGYTHGDPWPEYIAKYTLFTDKAKMNPNEYK